VTSSEVQLPGLGDAAVRRLARSWDDGGLWDDVRRLAERFIASQETDQLLAWDHLVLAVGNFKRQPGRRLRPPSLSDVAPAVPAMPSYTVVMPGTDKPLDAEKISSWQLLMDSLPGAAVATTTTLLAALWPDRHIVFDWRVHAAANGVRIHAGLKPTPGVMPDSSASANETLENYAIVRRWTLDTADRTGAPLVEVERAINRLSQEVPDSAGRTWREYGAAVTERLATASGD